jgi:hypothetical protein
MVDTVSVEECRIFKAVEITIRRGLKYKEKKWRR